MGYPSDMSDDEWSVLAPYFEQRGRGRPREHDIRRVLNGIRYLIRSGCQWRMLPKEYPPWETVYGYVRRWRRIGKWDAIHDALREAVRAQAGRAATPSAAIIDSQSVKTVQKGGKEATTQARRPKGGNATS
jgi:transposase